MNGGGGEADAVEVERNSSGVCVGGGGGCGPWPGGVIGKLRLGAKTAKCCLFADCSQEACRTVGGRRDPLLNSALFVLTSVRLGEP